MPEAVLVSAVRTPVGRAPKGALSNTRPDDLAALAVGGALDKVQGLSRTEIDDVILGCAQPEGEQGWDIARWAILRAGLPVEIPGATVHRPCSSGLEAIAIADQRIRSGSDRVVIAGGVESMSMLPLGGLKPSPNPWMAEHYPASLLTMGLTAERVARHYQVSREDQDAFAYESHQKALAAQAAGRFADELIPVPVTTAIPRKKRGDDPTLSPAQISRRPEPTPPPPSPRDDGLSRDHGNRRKEGRQALDPREDLRRRRRPPRRHIRRSPRQAQTRLPRAGHRHRRQLLANFRRGCCHRPHGSRPRQGTGNPSACSPGLLRRHRLPARGDGHRSRHRDSQGAATRWPQIG